ncbi:MAG TPA: TerB family tellurite resistance protein [Patescibacteria group bacterium]|nr:TerB family tellurite resistance protein [Patescibacteria group bacterium]
MASSLLKDIKLALGEIFSSGKIDEDRQVTLQVVFGLLGYLARADSIVTDDEATFLNNLMDDMSLSLSARKIAVDAMNRGKARQIDIAVELERFLSVHPAGSPEVGKLYETLLNLAGSDGRVRPREREFLEQITAGLGFTPDILDSRLDAMARRPVA